MTGGRDAQGPGLFKIPVEGSGAPVRLVAGQAVNPVWSPDGNLIVYAGRSVVGQVALLGVRPDAARLSSCRPYWPARRLSLPAQRNGLGVPARIQSLDFWLLDFATKQSAAAHPPQQSRHACGRSTSRLTGKQIVFDRSRQNSDIVLIDLPK